MITRIFTGLSSTCKHNNAKSTASVNSLFKCILLTNVLLARLCEGKPKICRHFESGSSEIKGNYVTVSDVDSPACPLSASSFSVYNVAGGDGGNGSEIARVLICWSNGVKRVALQFSNSVHLNDATSLQRTPLHACAKKNDTILIGRHQMRNNASHILLTLSVTGNHGYKFRGFVERRKPSHGAHRIIQYQYYPKTHRRRKRSTNSDRKKTEPIECGATRSCYRRGAEDCGHLSCEYFLSYTVKSSRIELELSARAPGWVAVGFSSDKRMGGDEVVACAKRGKLSDNVTAVTYTNKYQYDPPQRKEEPDILTLEQFEVKDGFIYCRISRPISADSFQDLTNTWYQLYASGQVSTGGDLEKHKVEPSMSKKLITTIKTTNYYTSGSTVASMAPVTIALAISIFIRVLST